MTALCVIVAGPRTAKRAVQPVDQALCGRVLRLRATRPAASTVLELAIATASCAATPTPGAGTGRRGAAAKQTCGRCGRLGLTENTPARHHQPAALRRVRPVDAAVEQRALQPLLATRTGPSTKPRTSPLPWTMPVSCPSLPTRLTHIGRVSVLATDDESPRSAGTSTTPGRSAGPLGTLEDFFIEHQLGARSGPSRRRAPPTTSTPPPSRSNWSRAVLRAPRRVPGTSDPSRHPTHRSTIEGNLANVRDFDLRTLQTDWSKRRHRRLEHPGRRPRSAASPGHARTGSCRRPDSRPVTPTRLQGRDAHHR